MAKYKWRVGLLAEFFPKVIDFIHHVTAPKADRPQRPNRFTYTTTRIHPTSTHALHQNK